MPIVAQSPTTTPSVVNLSPSGDATGNTDTAAIQAANNTCVAKGGGTVALGSGKFTVNAQLKIYPNVTLIGQGNGYDQAGSFYGTAILSTFNGSCILVQQDARLSTFVRLSNFALFGSSSLTSQNGIEWSTAGGAQVSDSIVENVVVILMGQHGFYLNANASKIQSVNCWIEFCGKAAIKDVRNNTGSFAIANVIIRSCTDGYDGSTAGFVVVDIVNANIDTLTGVGIKAPGNFSAISVVGGWIHSCAGGGVSLPADANQISIEGTQFKSNGTSSVAQLFGSPSTNQSSQVQVRARFQDTRTGGANVVNHVTLAASAAAQVVIDGCTFYGSQSDAVGWTSRSSNKIMVRSCLGYNDVKGAISTPFAASNRIGAAGTTATPTASTVYTVEGTDLMLAVSGGTGVSITIADAAGNTVQSGLTSYSGVLPIGYSINLGGFSVAPTIYAGVV